MKKLLTGLLLLASGMSAAGLKVETFNVGLARGFVDNAEERLPYIVEAIKKSDADVLCLQEVWSLPDRAEISRALAEKYSDIFLTPVYQTTTRSRPSCKPWQIFGKGKFVSCMNSECKEAEGDDFTDCIINKCAESLERLKRDNRECASALMAKVGKNPIVSVLQLLNPFYRSGLFAYRGSNGLILASKIPLGEKEILDFSHISTLNRRQALGAKIQHNGKEIQLLCTHLSASLNVPYTGVSRNWADENYTQALSILDKASSQNMAVVMGDFNCGLANPSTGLSEELPDTCRLLNQYFEDPLAQIGECSYCSSNSLNSGDTANVFIDHIYTLGVDSSNAKIKYKDKVVIDAGDQTKESNLSDHYGAQITID